jgi:PAS domain S-box-containing protein
MAASSGEVININQETPPQFDAKKFREPTRSEQRIAADILESIDDYISAFDKNWNFIYINKTTAQDFGSQSHKLIGRNIWRTFPHFVGTDLEKNYREAMAKRVVRRFEWKTIYANTGYRQFTVFPSAEGITVYGIDITERKLLEQKLEGYTKNLEKLVEERTRQLQGKERLATIGQTAGMVGHDIRNPLQSIVASMFLIKSDLESLPLSEEKTDALVELGSIQEQIRYVDKIVSDLQDYARLLKPEFVYADIKTLVTGALSTMDVPENIEASACFDGDLPKVRTDPLILKRVLLNLASNAIQSMREGGKMTIYASQNEKEKTISITIKDTGVGIPEAIKPKIFTPLFTTKAKGQGFGLAVVKRLVEGLNGQVTFESEEGKGSEFTVNLPY